MQRLRRADCAAPGITRRRRGKGFEYLDGETGERIEEPEVLVRIRDLAIPPAWRDVWICPYPMGHIQATGIDAAGRKQYLYHPKWREREDQKKFDHMLEFARALPAMRSRWAEHLSNEDLNYERALACACRLLDHGCFRIGTEGYAESNQTYGLATLHKKHVKLLPGNEVAFDYIAKGGKRRIQSVVDPMVYEVVDALKRRRGGGPELLAYRSGSKWCDVKSGDINSYIKEVSGKDFTAKDFRTWRATVLAALALAVSGGISTSKTGRKRAITRAIAEVAHYLGNTPAVCRASYIDPRVFDRYQSGWTVAGVIDDLGDVGDEGSLAIQGAVEEAVVDLIEDNRTAEAVQRTA